MRRQDVVPYWLAQLLAGLVAALLVVDLRRREDARPCIRTKASLLVEFLFTFALAWVVLNVATAKGDRRQFVLRPGHRLHRRGGRVRGGGISGGAFNPAVALGATVLGVFSWSHIWVYLIATFLGGAVAAGVFLYLQGPEAEAAAA